MIEIAWWSLGLFMLAAWVVGLIAGAHIFGRRDDDALKVAREIAKRNSDLLQRLGDGRR